MERMNMNQLRSLAKERNLRGYSRLRKADLINFPCENEPLGPKGVWAKPIEKPIERPIEQSIERPIEQPLSGALSGALSKESLSVGGTKLLSYPRR